jgi:hypothetical protein
MRPPVLLPHSIRSVSLAGLSAVCVGACLLVAGCGGGSKGPSATIKSECQAAQVAGVEYQEAVKELQLNFKEKLKVAAVLATTAAFRQHLQRLGQAETGQAREQMTGFAGALGRQEQIVRAFVAGNPTPYAPLAKGLNTELPAGFSNLSKICAKA